MARFTAQLCPRRAATVLVAAAVALQAFFTGLPVSGAGLAPEFAPAGLAAEMAVICHGQGSAAMGEPDHGAPSDPGKAAHPCCFACMSGGPPATLAPPPVALRIDRGRIVQTMALHRAAGPAGRRAVRDGPAQAPPTLA